MLPSRAYADPLSPPSGATRAQPSPEDARPVFVLAVSAADVEHFPTAPLTRIAARTTAEAIRLIERWRPRVIAIDWDRAEEFDGPAISSAARQTAFSAILVITA